MTDVFQVQADVAERVARELGVALATGERRHLESRPTGDLGAYDLYLRGRYAWHQRTAAGLDQARRLLEQAIAADPAFAPAHAALADVFVVLALWTTSRLTRPSRAPARPPWRRSGSTAHWRHPGRCWATYNAMYAWNWPEAERAFRRSPGARSRTTPTPIIGTTETASCRWAAWTRRFGRRGAPASSTRSA